MIAPDGLVAAAVVFLFLFSIVLAVAETAFVRVSPVRVRALEEEGRRGARRLSVMLASPEQTLNVVLLVVLVAQLGSASLLGVLVDRVFGPFGVAIGIVVNILAFFVVAEVAPKTWTLQHTETAALRVSPLLWFLTRFWPLRVVARSLIGLSNVLLPGKGIKEGPFVTEAEIRSMADLAADEAVIETEERELIHSVFEFGDTLVKEAMQPRTDMVAVPADAAVDETIRTAIEAGYSRMPAFGSNRDDIVGLVFLKDLVAAQLAGRGGEPVRDHLREPHFVPEHKRAAELLKEMQTEQFHMALVVDEYGGTAGLVTLEDLLEELVGEITDEYDVEEPRVEHLPDGRLRVPGRTPIDDVGEELGVRMPDVEWDTVAGLVFNTLGHVPEEGECVEFASLAFCAERVLGRRIVSVLVEPGAAADVAPVAAVE